MRVDPYTVLCYELTWIGTWLSLVEHCVRDAGVAGSNPVVPTIFLYLNRYYVIQ